MRLFEHEVRADSITASAPGPNFTTQASNFSLCKRSGISPVMTTVSMPNCLKQSDKTFLADSLISIRATRAKTFLLGGMGETVLLRAFSISVVVIALKLLFWPAFAALVKSL